MPPAMIADDRTIVTRTITIGRRMHGASDVSARTSTVAVAEHALDVGTRRRATVAEHERLDTGGEQLPDARVRLGEIVLIEMFLRLGAMHVAGERAAAKQVADERELAALRDHDERAGRVAGHRDDLGIDTARV